MDTIVWLSRLTGMSAMLAPLCLVLVGCITDRWANAHVLWIKRMTTALMVFALTSAVAATAIFGVGATSDPVIFPAASWKPVSFGVYLDGLSLTMMLLIGVIGTVIQRYSGRYLDGEPTQGRFLRAMSLTLGAVLFLVLSRNLVMFVFFWILTSLGLHQLLTHYRDRPGAQSAAHRKFLVSRLGDAFLLIALALAYGAFGTFEYSEIFSEATRWKTEGIDNSWLVEWMGAFFVLGAMTKSAQFPLHGWLPDTMETPTPVSALMHAGIINAGGFLIIRLSPLVTLSPTALAFLSLVGAITALFGAVVMLTQTSIKRSLAFSTIAQMGFMMFQCGLGAFSAALLHIVAHSLYKANAFLTTGEILDNAPRNAGAKTPFPDLSGRGNRLALLAAAACLLPISWAPIRILGFNPAAKPGAWVLMGIAAIAFTQYLWTSFVHVRSRSDLPYAFRCVFIAFGMISCYLLAYMGMDAWLGASIARTVPPRHALETVAVFCASAGFLATFILQANFGGPLRRSGIFRAAYVHACNGFYLDSFRSGRKQGA